MNHLEDGTLQALLDDELPSRERVAAAEHLLGCGECQAVRDELARANAVVSEAVAILDTATPARPAPSIRDGGRWLGGGSLVKAASLTLLLAAAASAAVPGSPVREWIVRTVAPTPEAPAPVVEEPAPPAEVVPIGVSMLPTGAVEVVVSGLERSTLRLVETDGESVGVSAAGTETDPVFRTAPGRIEVRGAVGGEITIELPRSLSAARVVVDGEVYAEKEAGELRLLVPAETVDGASIWR